MAAHIVSPTPQFWEHNEINPWHEARNESRRESLANSQFRDDLSEEGTLGSIRIIRHEDLGDYKRSSHGSNRSHLDGGEKGGDEGPPKPVGFWHGDLAKTRLQVFGLWARTTLILCVFILTVLSMYWAVLYHVEENLDSLIVYVVDFDGQVAPYIGANPIIGPMITQMTEEMVQVEPLNNIPHLGYVTRDAAAFDNDPLQVREAVYAQQAWAAIVINPNATALLQRAVELGNTSYDPTGACQLVWVEARDQDTMYDYVLPMLNTLETQISSKFGPMWAQQVLSNDSIPRATLAKVPQALNPGIGFSLYSLRPFVPAVTTPAVTIGLIYLIILAFFSFAFYLPIHMKFVKPEGHPPLHFYQMIIWRWLATITAYFFMSLAYSLISLAFQIPFDNPTASFTAAAEDPNAFGKGTFVVYWMINFVGMIALGLACENVAMIIGQPWTAMWLIFWVITNVSTAFYAIELSPRFYYWGYAWPLHNIVEASRTVLFDLHSRIGLNFGVLFAWAAINTLLFGPCCYFMRWKMQRGQRKEAEAKDRKG